MKVWITRSGELERWLLICRIGINKDMPFTKLTARKHGSVGGRSTVKKFGSSYMRKLGKRGRKEQLLKKKI